MTTDAPAAATSMIPGIHHVTAITGDVKRNVEFYTGLLGLRLVKITVNYDDPTSYHLYYGDRLGTPGTLLTFFGWPDAPRVPGGTGQVSTTAYAVDTGSLEFWRERLANRGLNFQAGERFGEHVLCFTDPDGMSLEIIGARESDASRVWLGADVPEAHALRGFHSVTLLLREARLTHSLLTEHLGFARIADEGTRSRYRAPNGTHAASVDMVEQPETRRGRMGVGQVHHVALRTPDDASQVEWQGRLSAHGYRVSAVMNRDYFHSIYFAEPGGVLFEIATDGPGMTINEPAETLGTRLVLPAGVEQYRAQLEKILPPL
jgi:glyoxalase family protein